MKMVFSHLQILIPKRVIDSKENNILFQLIKLDIYLGDLNRAWIQQIMTRGLFMLRRSHLDLYCESTFLQGLIKIDEEPIIFSLLGLGVFDL